MPQSFKKLGAVVPTANTQTNVYVVPASTEAVLSTITICNQTAVNTSYSLMYFYKDEFATAENAPSRCFLVRGAVVPAADTIVLTMGLTANADSIISCNATGSDISFSAFGSEIT